MSKLRSLIIAGISALFSAVCLGLDPAAREGFDEAMRSIEQHRLLPAEVLEDPRNREWVENLREEALRGTLTSSGSILFLNLGHSEVMQKYLEIYSAQRGEMYSAQRGDVGFIFAHTIQPKIISAIADDLYREEPAADTRPIDNRQFPASILACYVTQEIIKNSPVFSEDLKKWARKVPTVMLSDEDTARQRRKEIRVWWTENRILFEQERYAEVKPPPVAELKSSSSATLNPPAGATPPRSQTLAQTPPAASPSPTTPVAQTPAVVAEQRAPVWPWLVGILTLLVIIAAALKRRA